MSDDMNNNMAMGDDATEDTEKDEETVPAEDGDAEETEEDHTGHDHADGMHDAPAA